MIQDSNRIGIAAHSHVVQHKCLFCAGSKETKVPIDGIVPLERTRIGGIVKRTIVSKLILQSLEITAVPGSKELVNSIIAAFLLVLLLLLRETRKGSSQKIGRRCQNGMQATSRAGECYSLL
jgi:hypothetical protein